MWWGLKWRAWIEGVPSAVAIHMLPLERFCLKY
jgi:hypothetical protein